MCQIEVIIRLKETEGQQVIRETELSTHSFDLLDIDTLRREERIDRMEEATMRQGWQIMRQLYLTLTGRILIAVGVTNVGFRPNINFTRLRGSKIDLVIWKVGFYVFSILHVLKSILGRF